LWQQEFRSLAAFKVYSTICKPWPGGGRGGLWGFQRTKQFATKAKNAKIFVRILQTFSRKIFS